MRATYQSTAATQGRSRSSAPRHDPITACPAQAVFGSAARAVFAANPALVTETIEQCEDFGIIDLALVRLVPRRHRRDLHVSDQRQMLFESPDEIAADDLRVIEVELNAQVRPLHLGDDVGRLLGAGEEIVR